MVSSTPNRVRSIYMDMLRGDTRFPQRGDRITTGKTLYWVAMSRRVNRRDPSAPPRIIMGVITSEDIEPDIKAALLRSAMRRDASVLFTLRWYPREKKRISFEQYISGGGN